LTGWVEKGKMREGEISKFRRHPFMARLGELKN
jgi:hypothetical protein